MIASYNFYIAVDQSTFPQKSFSYSGLSLGVPAGNREWFIEANLVLDVAVVEAERSNLENPSCSQCIRAHVDCPGYRDLRSLLFLNESEDVSRKVEKQHSARKRTQKQVYSLHGKSRGVCVKNTVMSMPGPGLSMAIHDQALCFVHHNYLRNWLWLCGNDTLRTNDVALTSATTAIGLSAMANMRMSSPLMLAAREEYIKALSATNQNIMDPRLSKTDGTLVAVMFLGMFEVITFNDLESIQRWMKHIEGAAKLLEWRGEEQLQNPRGLHLFRLMRAQIILQNIFQESYTSAVLVELSEKACNSEFSTSRYADELATLTIQLSSLCANINKGVVSDAAAKIGFALALDAEMEAWANRVPPEYRFESSSLPAESYDWMNSVFGIYGAQYHTYKDLFSCAVWNNWRTARIVLHEIILRSCDSHIEASRDAWMSTRLFGNSHLATRSRNLLISMSEEICASVPYHFGVSEVHSPNDSVSVNGFGIAAGHILFWPLFEAADSMVASPRLKSWAIGCLEKIGHGMGISQALAMAELLRESLGSRTWIKSEAIISIE